MEDSHFQELLTYLNFSWRGYRKVRKGVKKRISRHMQQLGCRNISNYLSELDGDFDLREQCEQLMTVSISRFFRDRILWDVIRNKVFPEIIQCGIEEINIWSAGCARGEEVYSIKIIWDIIEAELKESPVLKILATDINPDYLEKAKCGVYTLSSMKEVTSEYRKKYFDIKKGGRRFEVKPFLKKDIQWKVHNLKTDPPESGFQIIFLRNNILTYCQDFVKFNIFRQVAESLSDAGFIITGSHEKLPAGTEDIIPFKHHPNIFRKHKCV